MSAVCLHHSATTPTQASGSSLSRRHRDGAAASLVAERVRRTSAATAAARAIGALLARSTAGAPRDATVTVLPQDTVLVPLIGRIAAGPPILAEENFEDFIPLPRWLSPGLVNCSC
jgi:SOS-response transcriptional repressor LexA